MSGTDDELAPVLARVARDALAEPTVEATALTLSEAALEMVPEATAAGISMVRRGGRLETSGATDEVVRKADALQYELDEGPCVDAVWHQAQVHAPDLAAEERWPRWAPRVAADLGVGSMLCSQLWTHDDRVGALNVYARSTHAFESHDLDATLLLAAHAATALAAAQRIENLTIAVDRRTTIGKALGVLQAAYGLDGDRALQVLRRLSSHQNRKLFDVAAQVAREGGVPAVDESAFDQEAAQPPRDEPREAEA